MFFLLDHLTHRLAQDFQTPLGELDNTFSKGDKNIKRTEVREEKSISEVSGTHALKIHFTSRRLNLNSGTIQQHNITSEKRKSSESLWKLEKSWRQEVFFPTSCQEYLETVKQEHLGGQCLEFTNHLENHLCWHLAPQCRAWLVKDQPTQPSDHWVHAKTSENHWVKEFGWGNPELPSRRSAEELREREEHAAGTAEQSRKDFTCKTLRSGKELSCPPLPSEHNHGKQEGFHQGFIRNTETVTTGLWFASFPFSFYLCSFPTPHEKGWVMTGILGGSLHTVFHFPRTHTFSFSFTSFLPVENFSNPFSPLEEAQGSTRRKKEKTCHFTTLYLFQRWKCLKGEEWRVSFCL